MSKLKIFGFDRPNVFYFSPQFTGGDGVAVVVFSRLPHNSKIGWDLKFNTSTNVNCFLWNSIRCVCFIFVCFLFATFLIHTATYERACYCAIPLFLGGGGGSLSLCDDADVIC